MMPTRKEKVKVAEEKTWHDMCRQERRERLKSIIEILEQRKRKEPIPKTCGDWWKSADHMQVLARFVYVVLESEVVPA